jgi:hypothetical protein
MQPGLIPWHSAQSCNRTFTMARMIAKYFGVAFLLVASWTPSVQAQMFQCPSGTTQVGGGGGIECRCPDGSLYGVYSRCGGSYQQQNQPQGVYCGDWTCPFGSSCSRSFGRCVPQDRVDCGEFNCPQGTYCASNHSACLTQLDTDCGGYHCGVGQKCSSNRSCIPTKAADCGAGKGYCNEGNKCSRDGERCLSQDAVDCGTYTCNSESKCGSGNKCLARTDVDCGGGRSCNAGYLCVRGGAECLTSQQLADRAAAEKRQKEEETARRKREAEERQAAERRRIEEQREAARLKEEERKREIARKQEEAEAERRAVAEAKRQAVEEAKRKAEEAARQKATTVQSPAGPCAQVISKPVSIGSATTIATPTDITTALKQAQEIYDRINSGATVAKPATGRTPTQSGAAPIGSLAPNKQSPNNCYTFTPTADALQISQGGKLIGALTPIQLKFLAANSVSLTPPYPSAANPPPSAPVANIGRATATITGFSSAKLPNQTTNLWNRVGNALQFANKSVADDPNFRAAAMDLRMTAAIAGIGCIVGGAVGAGAGAGVAALPGCIGGAEFFTGVYGAGSAGIAVADGLLDIFQHQYGKGVTEVAQTAAENFADNPSPLGGIASGIDIGGSWGTYFLYGVYNNVPGH